MLKDGGCREHTNAHFRGPYSTELVKLFVDNCRHAKWQTAAKPFLRPVRHPPSRLSKHAAPFNEAAIGVPIFCQIISDLAAHFVLSHIRHESSPQFFSIRSRFWFASPRNTSLAFARLNQRWVSLSKVNPMPPCI